MTVLGSHAVPNGEEPNPVPTLWTKWSMFPLSNACCSSL
jgi:hypothetical protein